ncbi:MAG: hypothetical protein WC796_02365 [Candidatus Pacearchaeota archaeon]|jgi:WD40 repeat protein
MSKINKRIIVGIFVGLIFIISLFFVSGENQYKQFKQIKLDDMKKIVSNYSFTDTYSENVSGKWRSTFLYTVNEVDSQVLDAQTLDLTLNISRTAFGDWVASNCKTFGFFNKKKLMSRFSNQNTFKHKTLGNNLSLINSADLIDDLKNLNVLTYDGEITSISDTHLDLDKQKPKVVNLRLSGLNLSDNSVNLKFGHSSVNWSLERTLQSIVGNGVWSLLFISNDQKLVVGSEHLFVYNTLDWSLNKTLPCWYGIATSALSSDDQLLACQNEKDVVIYNITNWAEVINLTNSNSLFANVIRGIDFSQNNKWVAYSFGLGESAQINLNNFSTWENFKNLTNPTNQVTSVHFSPNNLWLAAGSLDHKVYIYNTTDWSNFKNLTSANDYVYSLSFSPDGQYLAASSEDYKVYIYNTTDWSNLKNLTNSTDIVYSVSFSPDGQYLAAGSSDRNVSVYKTSDWVLNVTLNNSIYGVMSVAFSKNGRLIAYGDAESVYIHIFNNLCQPPSLGNWIINETCNVIGQNYTVNSGNLTIQDVGLLNMSQGSNVTFSSAGSYIFVYRGGQIYLQDKSGFNSA